MTRDDAELIRSVGVEQFAAIVREMKECQELCTRKVMDLGSTHDMDMYFKGGYWMAGQVMDLKANAERIINPPKEEEK